MRVLVTGAAGFIGCGVAAELLAQGHEVVGIDSFTDYYARNLKDANVQRNEGHERFTFTTLDIAHDDLTAVYEGVDVVIHLAAQAGVRLSWSAFDRYTNDNLLATQRIFTQAVDSGVPRVVFASSSSVYGDGVQTPTAESHPMRPVSPYGVTKYACEALASAFTTSFPLSILGLRYFTVFGPRQRPDMAMHRLLRSAQTGATFKLLGDGEQVRDFTYIDDIVAGTVAAAGVEVPGFEPLNLGGAGGTTMNELIALIEDITGSSVNLERHPAARGDVRRTGADISRAKELLDWEPRTDLRTGLEQHAEHLLQTRDLY